MEPATAPRARSIVTPCSPLSARSRTVSRPSSTLSVQAPAYEPPCLPRPRTPQEKQASEVGVENGALRRSWSWCLTRAAPERQRPQSINFENDPIVGKQNFWHMAKLEKQVWPVTVSVGQSQRWAKFSKFR
eukprot:TRINITY_DN17451_c0_g2_i1.p2 TRINITY_DN17451_c0_g2~~TRINITY_DN17451_c0_g2_i1.p2  ORF type:complete len:131 (-),score=5.10 TRINITY_DN17451_c0_g2_i1:96-488(-)